MGENEREDMNALKRREDAELLAYKIREYWFSQGYPLAAAWVEEFARETDGSPCFTVKSNLVNGSPPRRAMLMASA